MAYTPTKLFQNAQASTTETTIYTSTSPTQTIIKQIIIANTTTSAATYSVSHVPSGGTAGAGNRLISGVSISANSTVIFDLSAVMAANDFVSIKQGTSAAITASGYGVTF